MKLKEGLHAPNFEKVDIADEPVTLEAYRGKKLLLSFYRYAACALCNLRVHRLVTAYPRLADQGLHALAFFQSPKESILEHVGKHEAPFPIVPDPDREIYRLYGVEGSWAKFFRAAFRAGDLAEATRKGLLKVDMEGEKNMIPADFLVDADLVVRRAYYGKDAGDHLPIEEIQTFASS